MKVRSLLAAFAVTASMLLASPLWADNYKVDPVHSSRYILDRPHEHQPGQWPV